MYGKDPFIGRPYFELNFDQGFGRNQIKLTATTSPIVYFSADSVKYPGNWMSLTNDSITAEGGGIRLQLNEMPSQKHVIEQNFSGSATCHTMREVEVCESEGRNETCRDLWENCSFTVTVKGNLVKVDQPIIGKIISNNNVVATFKVSPFDYRFERYEESLEANCPDRL